MSVFTVGLRRQRHLPLCCSTSLCSQAMVAVAKATEDLYAQDRPGLRGDLIKAAVDNLRSHASACQAILVLSKLMESHPAAALTERLIGRRELLDQIWEEGNILELGVSDALHFIRASRSGRFTHSDLGSGAAPSIASDAAAAGASEAAPPSLPAARSLSRGSSIRAQREAPTSVFTALPMLEQLRTRLRFITLAARLSGQGLPIVQVRHKHDNRCCLRRLTLPCPSWETAGWRIVRGARQERQQCRGAESIL